MIESKLQELQELRERWRIAGAEPEAVKMISKALEETTKTMKNGYELTKSQIDTLSKSGSWYEILVTAYKYGYARGRRAERKEKKKTARTGNAIKSAQYTESQGGEAPHINNAGTSQGAGQPVIEYAGYDEEGGAKYTP